jgi:hypothetical protein
MMNRLQIRLGGPYFAAFLVNRMTIDLQNRQMGLAGISPQGESSQNLSSPSRILASIPISPTGS